MTKISQLSDIGGNLAADDEFVIRDVSDGSTPNKKVTSSGFIDYVINQGNVTGFTKITAGSGPQSQVLCTSSGADSSIIFTTNASPRATIDDDGRLLVGTSTARSNFNNNSTGSETSPLQAEGISANTAGAAFIHSGANALPAVLQFAKQRSGTVGGNTIVQNNDYTGYISFEGSDGSEFVRCAAIEALVDGTPGTNDMPGRIVLSTTASGQSSPTERMRIDSSGRVGIGTTGPGSYNSGFNQLVVGSSGDQGVTIAAGTSNSGTLAFADGTSGSDAFRGYVQYQHQNNALLLGTDAAERARIDSSGRLLVGTSTALGTNTLLELYKSSGNVFGYIRSDSLANNEQAAINVYAQSKTQSYGIYKHSSITNPCGYLGLTAEDNANNFLWADNSDILRISTDANHIGTTSGTVVGTQTSDERIKNILGPVEYGLDTLKQIEPVRFSLKSEPETEKLGFIAQQVQPLVPQSVFDTGEPIEGEPEDAPTKLGMEYVALIPVLVNAIKELSAEVDGLKAQLQAQ